MPDTALEIRDLTREVTQQGEPRRIVDGFTFTFNTGGKYVILGPSGSGKTSLLRLINRLDERTGGEIIFGGHDTHDHPPCELRRKIAYLFQTPHVIQGSMGDNLRFADDSISKGEMKRLLHQVQLAAFDIDSSAANLSTGEKQRLALARLLATEPAVILLDEPTAALDPSRTEAIESLIRSLVEDHQLTVLMVSHDPQQALRIGGEALLMVEGRLIEHGPVSRIVNDPQTDLGRRYRDKELS
ncbi:MAG: ATP-binding cassette domain-containing protein [bacterium]